MCLFVLYYNIFNFVETCNNMVERPQEKFIVKYYNYIIQIFPFSLHGSVVGTYHTKVCYIIFLYFYIY